MIELKRPEEIKTYDEVIEAIREFCNGDNWERAFTFGHITLGDYNLSDGNIQFCLRQSTIHDWFIHKLECLGADPESEEVASRADYRDLARERDTIIFFLRWLLEIPEEIREDEQ
jgi:hypothetical protein